MIKGYRSLRCFCHNHEWAAGLSAALLLALLGLSIFITLEYQGNIWHWLSSSLLINGLIMAAIMLLAGGVSLSLLCLSFGQCSTQERIEIANYRNRRLASETLEMVRNLGGNPKRRRRQVHNASA